MSHKLVDVMVNMKEEEAVKLAREMLESGEDPLNVLSYCREAMNIIGKRFEEGIYFLPELILAGEILKKIAPMTQEKIGGEPERKRAGKILIGTVEGDIHDIGKDIVVFMLDANGFEVLDLGIDVPVKKFVDAIKDFQPQVVGLSGFLTLAFDSMKKTVEAIRDVSSKDDLKIMIGGGQIDDEIRMFTGADAYGLDAMAAVTLSKGWIGGE